MLGQNHFVDPTKPTLWLKSGDLDPPLCWLYIYIAKKIYIWKKIKSAKIKWAVLKFQ
jgi:hypothetical protein